MAIKYYFIDTCIHNLIDGTCELNHIYCDGTGCEDYDCIDKEMN